MIVGLLGVGAAVAALAGFVVVPDFVIAPDLLGRLICTAAENVPCRPLTLECLVAAAGGLGVAWPAVSNDPPVPPDAPYDEGSQRPQDNTREYAPDPPPGSQPPRPQSPQDALNDEAFRKAKEDWARENSDQFPTIPAPPSDGDSVYDALIKSIQNKEQR